jgi:hypothetical protein
VLTAVWREPIGSERCAAAKVEVNEDSVQATTLGSALRLVMVTGLFTVVPERC